MAKLITKFRYYKPMSKTKIGGYVRYIATREGVEKPMTYKKLPVTTNQKQLIERILTDFPDSKQMPEYEDYIASPTASNASEFIGRALEDNAPDVVQSTYADYIATRPGVEKQGSHGLFSFDDRPIILSALSDGMNRHTGNFWTMIVSLRREDAERLGYNTAAQWKDTLRKHSRELSEALKIPLGHLRWYAAFHNQSHHPHVHLIAYSVCPGEGYLTRQGVTAMRSALGQDIFRDELEHVYAQQTEYRNILKTDWKALLEDVWKQTKQRSFSDPDVEQKLVLLSRRLRQTKGKQVYGYLSKDTKELVDAIADRLAENEGIARLYELWYEKKYEILRTYTDELPPKIPLSKNKEFRSIRNEIIREALKIRAELPGTSPGIEPAAQASKHSAATAVTGLFKYLSGILQNGIVRDDSKKIPVIDRRLKREMEEKKHAEISMT